MTPFLSSLTRKGIILVVLIEFFYGVNGTEKWGNGKYTKQTFAQRGVFFDPHPPRKFPKSSIVLPNKTTLPFT